MSIWAIIPVKPLRRGKSRLEGVLTEAQRFELNRWLLTHTLERLHRVGGIEHILVVSRDPEALAVARERGARTLLEDGSPELNVALTRAKVVATAYSVHGVLILPADLPQLDPHEVEALISLADDEPVVAISPDRQREGTNALFLSPPDVMEVSYGPGSFERHCALARNAGAKLEILDLLSISLDVDRPEDLSLLGEAFSEILAEEFQLS